MTGVATAAAWLLAAVLAASAVAKATRPRATAAALRRLRLPAPRAATAGLLVVEPVVAVVLVVRPRAGGVAALVLLGLFTAVVADRLRRGLAVPCGCFGGSGRAPLSAATLVRNVLLACAAAVALAAPAPLVPALPDVLAAAGAAATGVVVHALVDLRGRTGRLWDNRLEPGPEAAT